MHDMCVFFSMLTSPHAVTTRLLRKANMHIFIGKQASPMYVVSSSFGLCVTSVSVYFATFFPSLFDNISQFSLFRDKTHNKWRSTQALYSKCEQPVYQRIPFTPIKTHFIKIKYVHGLLCNLFTIT